MKQSIASLLLVLLTGCAAPEAGRSPGRALRSQITDDLAVVRVVAIVELAEAQVAGNGPIVDRGADVKTEVAIDKRVYTRGEIELRGNVLRYLKGSCPTNRISFNIATQHLVSGRDNWVLRVPASNIPDLKIGAKYVIMLDPTNAPNLYFTSIWPMGSTEAVFVEDILEGCANVVPGQGAK